MKTAAWEKKKVIPKENGTCSLGFFWNAGREEELGEEKPVIHKEIQIKL